MDRNEMALERRQRDLDAYLSTLNDPMLNQLLADIAALKRSIEIVKALDEPEPAKSNGHNPVISLPEPVFNLRGSLKKVLAEIIDQEVNVTILFNLMKARYPNEDVRKGSLSATLSILAKQGYLKETYAGHGSDPKRYLVLKGDAK